MHSKEPLVRKDSQYFVYTPSATALRVYLYPQIIGYFCYEPGYLIRRTRYDNYLLMYVEKGELFIAYEGKEMTARQGQVVLLDCRKPHAYGNRTDQVAEIAGFITTERLRRISTKSLRQTPDGF